jgi:Bifunctional DNA primase/polymerase, N-terminal
VSATRPYHDGAPVYLTKGWTGVLPLPPGRKKSPPSSYTGWNGRDPSAKMIETWQTQSEGDFQGASNICIHMPDGVVGIDVDHYTTSGGTVKAGGATLAHLESQLGPLPPTYLSTARNDGVSGIRWFRVEPGMRWPTGPGKDIEFIHKGHRYAVVWPSINPETHTEYFWIDHFGNRSEPPEADELAWLPDEWQARFTGGVVFDGSPEPRAATEEEFGECLTDGEMCQAVQKALAKFGQRIQTQARHDAMIKTVKAIVRLGEQGHRGTLKAIKTLKVAFIQLVGDDRDEAEVYGTEWHPSEFQRAVSGAVVKVLAAPTAEENKRCCGISDQDPFGGGTPAAAAPENPDSLVLPQSFYEARPYLKEIQTYAHDRDASADGVLYATLARLSGMVPHACRIDTGVLRPASANLFVVAAGGPGAGKSSTADVAKNLYQCPLLDFMDGLPLGTGEGMVETYFDWVYVDDLSKPLKKNGFPAQKREKQQVRHNAFLVADEGQAMVKLMQQRNGSILAETIRTMWIGGTTGQNNAHAETRRILYGGSYSLGLFVGFQMDTVQPLLADDAGGTPQRFVYSWVDDPTIPDTPNGGSLDPFAHAPKVFAPRAGVIQMAPAIRAEIKAIRTRRRQGAEHVHRLDAHDYLTKAKLAGLLCLMDGRSVVDEDDWALAGIMWEVSCNVRNSLLAYGKSLHKQEAQQRNEAYASREGLAEYSRQAARESHGAPGRVAVNIANKVHYRDDLRTMGAVNRTLARRDQNNAAVIDRAWEIAVDEGWVVVSGKDVEPGDQRPA